MPAARIVQRRATLGSHVETVANLAFSCALFLWVLRLVLRPLWALQRPIQRWCSIRCYGWCYALCPVLLRLMQRTLQRLQRRATLGSDHATVSHARPG